MRSYCRFLFENSSTLARKKKNVLKTSCAYILLIIGLLAGTILAGLMVYFAALMYMITM